MITEEQMSLVIDYKVCPIHNLKLDRTLWKTDVPCHQYCFKYTCKACPESYIWIAEGYQILEDLSTLIIMFDPKTKRIWHSEKQDIKM